MQNLFRLSLFLIAALMTSWGHAHNNPTFKEQILMSVNVNVDAASKKLTSLPFELKLPDETVQLRWRIQTRDGADKITFGVRQGKADLLSGISTDGLTNVVSGPEMIVTNVAGTDRPFTVEIVAKIINAAGAASAASKDGTGSDVYSKVELEGLNVYRRANCVGCHKWHGDGGGGYGGAARSLRATALDARGLTQIVRCGIPGSGMPYHGREAYQDDADKSCYGQTRADFGSNMPPRTSHPLSDEQIEAVVAYVVNKVKGNGEPTVAECEAFWGKNKLQCEAMK